MDKIAKEREFEIQNVLKRKEKYLATNPIDRYKNDLPYQLKIDFIKSKLINTKGLILDIGGNTAGEATILQTMGYKFVVGDINEHALSISKERVIKYNLPMPFYITLDAHNLPFNDSVFDQVTIIEALHHFVDYSRVLNEVYRVLKPGGNFVSLEPYKYNPIRRLSEVRDYFRGTIEKSFSVKQLKRLLSGCKFIDVRVDFISTGRSNWKLQEIPLYRRWFAVFHGYLNKKLPFVFGNLLINAKKEGELINNELQNCELITILRCPITKEKLIYDNDRNMLVNESNTYGYKYFNSIPNLLKEETIKL